MRIYLVGLSGAGKTHWGQWLANSWNWPFCDLDAIFEQHTNMPIADFFAQYGEHAFRQKEQINLHQTEALKQAIIATGGGTPIYADNMQWMNAHGITVFLHQKPAQIINRLTEADLEKRPLLLQTEALQSLETLYLERLPIYKQAQIEVLDPEVFNWDSLRAW